MKKSPYSNGDNYNSLIKKKTMTKLFNFLTFLFVFARVFSLRNKTLYNKGGAKFIGNTSFVLTKASCFSIFFSYMSIFDLDCISASLVNLNINNKEDFIYMKNLYLDKNIFNYIKRYLYLN